MRKLKGMLITAGMLLILSGISLQVPEEAQTLWEEIPDEEIHTYIQEKRETENISEYEAHSESAEGASESGQDSGSE